MALNLRMCVPTASHLKALSFSDKKYYSYFRGKRQRGEAAQMAPERVPATLRFRSWNSGWHPRMGLVVSVR